MAQDYTSSFGWAQAYPIKRHETLSSKEQTIGDFRRRLQDVDCLPRVTILAYMRDSTGQTLMTGSLVTFCAHCLEHKILCALRQAMIFL